MTKQEWYERIDAKRLLFTYMSRLLRNFLPWVKSENRM